MTEGPSFASGPAIDAVAALPYGRDPANVSAMHALLLTALLATVPVQNVDLAERAAAVRAEAKVPGLGLMLLRPDAEPEIAVAGVRLAGGDATVAVDDLWHWGSITKSMTATLVARLVEREVVRWEDTVGERLGEAVPDMRDEYRDVNFLHLLSHRGGLPSNISTEHFESFGQNPEEPISDRLAFVRYALAQEPVGPKEANFEYSNNGVIVAGAMLEAASGESWEALMRREVFEPLGMKSAGFGAPLEGQPRGHVSSPEGPQPVPPNSDNPAAVGPAGRVHMSLADMARYLDVHVRERGDFLDEGSFAALHSIPFGGNYALGWMVTSPSVGWHNGSNTMWYAEVSFDRESGTCAAVAVNDGDLNRVQPKVSALLRELMKN